MPIRPLLLVLLLPYASLLSAQQRDTTIHARSVVAGVVYDSVSATPLAGARVQLTGDDSSGALVRTTASDTAGRYRIENVPAGRYTIGFFHPMLDSLGLEPPLRGLLVRQEPEVRADLAIPSAPRIAYAVCGPRHEAAGALLMGIVRDARTGEPVSGAEVIGEWIEFTVSKSGVMSSVPRLADTTRANGWFALCHVPSPGRLSIATNHGADSSGRIEVELSSAGFLRRDLFIGSAGDSSLRRVSGTVVTREGARPLREALVGVMGGPQARTNESGNFTVDAPSGTRVLEVHAIGYYPERVTVNVMTGTPPVHVALYTMRAMLDTIKVVAKRTTPAMRAFEERRRAGMGRYLDAAYIAHRHATWTSELFRLVPGVNVTGGVTGQSEGGVYLRSPIAEGYCSPAFYLDGAYVGPVSSGILDAWVSPEDVAGIEIYRAPLVPAQFAAGGTEVINCGAIAVWTAPSLVRSTWSLKRRVFTAAALMGTGYLFGSLARQLLVH